jgi:hypothetical protein
MFAIFCLTRVYVTDWSEPLLLCRCNLAQEYGDVINLHDWYLSFDGIINNKNSKGKRKLIGSPSKKKSKAYPQESEAMIQYPWPKI